LHGNDLSASVLFARAFSFLGVETNRSSPFFVKTEAKPHFFSFSLPNKQVVPWRLISLMLSVIVNLQVSVLAFSSKHQMFKAAKLFNLESLQSLQVYSFFIQLTFFICQ
jgi:hypothetical protein